jgi:surfactin synthase thioesterase subunit
MATRELGKGRPVSMALQDWLPTLGNGINCGELPLFCFPFAGGGASVFHKWSGELPRTIRALPVQLPGREGRWAEKAFSSVPVLVPVLADALSSVLKPPFALFGHSMGAFIAFDLARELQRRGLASPARLFVSACRAPQIPDPDPPLYTMTEDEFALELKRLNGIPPEVFENREYMELILPMLKADFELCDTYVYRNGAPLECGISAFRGKDDWKVGSEHVTPWGAQTKAGYIERICPGDHFFLNSSQADLLAAIAADLLPVTRCLS